MIIYEQFEYKEYLIALRKHSKCYVASIFYPIPSDKLDSTVPNLRIKSLRDQNHNWLLVRAKKWVDYQSKGE
jgi:hypothetical protein